MPDDYSHIERIVKEVTGMDTTRSGKRACPEDVEDDPAGRLLSTTKRRRHPDAETPRTARYSRLKDVFDYPEVFLNILSFLSAQDLVQFERVSRYWKRICNDQWLWKRIYLAQYPYPTSRQQRIIQSRRSIRRSEDVSRSEHVDQFNAPITPVTASSSSTGLHSIPSLEDTRINPRERLASPSVSQEDDLESRQFFRPRIDWKLLTKIGTNWATGTAAQYSLSPSPSPGPTAVKKVQSELLTPTKALRSNQRDTIAPPIPRAAGLSSIHRAPHSWDGRHLLELSPSFIFVAYPTSPLLHVHSSNQSDLADFAGNTRSEETNTQSVPLALIPPPPGWSSPSRPDHITCIKVDSNDTTSSEGGSSRRGAVRLVVFYQSGGFVVLSVKSDPLPATTSLLRTQSRITWSRLVVYTPSDVSRRTRRSGYSRQRGDPTVFCEFHSPVLVSCTERFYISVWRLPDLFAVGPQTNVDSLGKEAQDGPVLLQTLHSPVSFHPAALRLQLLDQELPDAGNGVEEDLGLEAGNASAPVHQAYRASLAYSVPLYPERWTLAIQDIDISIPLSNDGLAPRYTAGIVECGECFHVGRSTTLGSKTMARRWPLIPRSEIVGVKGDRAIGIGLGEKCCVLAGSDNQIQVYEIPDRDHLGRNGAIGTSNNGSTQHDNAREHRSAHTASTARREIKHVQTLLAHSSAITAIALDQDRCVSAGNDGRILVWQVDRAADVFPADGTTDVSEAEQVDAADLLGGWVNVPSLRRDTTGGASDQQASGMQWSHVEVRTPHRTALPGPANDRSDKLSHLETTLPPTKRFAHPSSLTSMTLHQQILPIPPVTHPLSLASAAREYFISGLTGEMEYAQTRAYEEDRARRVVEQLAFNDDRIVGLVRNKGDLVAATEDGVGGGDGVIKVWTFDM